MTNLSQVFGWGESQYGQLGMGRDVAIVTHPKPVTSLLDQQIVKIACGGHHSLALTETGRYAAD